MKGLEFKEFRNSHSLSQDEVSRILKIKSGRQYVSYVEKQEEVPHIFFLFYSYTKLFGIKTAKRHFMFGFDHGNEE